MEASEARKLRSLEKENPRLKRIDFYLSAQARTLRRSIQKMVGISPKRHAIRMIVAEGFGKTAEACLGLNLGRYTYYFTNQKSEVSHLFVKEIISKDGNHPC